ncbi:PAS domain S-box protein [Arenibacter aquaticus]|uniref:histidine kinase n=1 Tax=Arenibacter aquaticus TaxID=2489054 RepID=A0A3S0IMD9_9FLAO|nr:PAS domain S-box protein [Arenibacter aquaticus]RTE53351.1 PAS domain S-box protein [Arenibacter aquaticus]
MNKPKSNRKVQEEYNKIFIEQAPTAIAMLDNDMKYIAVSQRWLKDYKLEGQKIIGRSHYEIFPEIGDDWKENHKKCLQGEINKCDEAPFRRADGSVQWIYWDVRPWYITDGSIGGLIMHTGDITHLKEKDLEKSRIEAILEKTNEVARIGTWEFNIIKNEIFWSKIIKEIHEVPEDYKPNFEECLLFFKEGESREKAVNATNNALTKGTPFDLELEIVTAKGNSRWVRAIGKSETTEGKTNRLFGIFQDISKIKLSELALDRAHSELKAIFNSRSIAIISTDKDGIIKNFNRGAEALLGYKANEVIGVKKPSVYLLEEEVKKFTKDIAESFGKNAANFNHYSDLAGRELNDTREWTYIRKDGSTFPALCTLSAIKNSEGQNEGFIAVSTNISEIKKVENELLRKNQMLNVAEKITMMGNWQWDTITNVVKWSKNLYSIFELDESQEELTYDTYFSFVHPDDQKDVTTIVQQSIKDKKFHDFIHRIITKTGKTKTVQLLAEIITNDQGEVIEMIGTCQDVTEQKMAEKKFRGLLESAPDAIVIVNATGKIQLINKQAEKLFGYQTEELHNKPVEILIPARFTTKHTDDRKRFFLTPKTRIMGEGKELYGLKKNGKEIPVQISLSPLHTEEGLLVSAAIRDITKQKLAEQKIIESKENLEIIAEKLRHQNKQLADFTHITSHNLRAPVSNLNALLSLYKEGTNEVDKNDLFNKFETVIHHLTSTLNTLMLALKIESEDLEEDLETIRFEDILHKTKEILSGEIINSGSVIDSDFSKCPKIKYKRIYLESIFLNLIGNAIKYRSHLRTPEICIESALTDEGKAVLTFKDNGLGIDLERHGHKLFGLNKVFHRHPDAKGVGLFLTKTQIKAMGGHISATSKVDEGTTFTINFN